MIIALAPMDWITDCAYRLTSQKVFEKHNQKDTLALFTEFMSADGYVHNPNWVFHHILKTNYEKNITAQIFWWNKENLIKTAKDIEENYDYDMIELNIGCPSPKIMSCWWWAWMLKDKKNTLEIVKNISQSIKTPFSIKTRTWLDEKDKEEQFNFILEASKYCNTISIHWRSFKQSHAWYVDWDFIEKIKAKVWKKSKIIWNWWINSYQEWIEKWKNLDGIMIWQAAIWNPWIFTEHNPNEEELKNTIIYHLDAMIALEYIFENIKEKRYLDILNLNDIDKIIQNTSIEELDKLRSPVIFRKHLFSYIKWIPWNKEFKQKIVKNKEYSKLKKEIEKFFL